MKAVQNGSRWEKDALQATSHLGLLFRGGKPGLPKVTRESMAGSGFGSSVFHLTPQRYSQNKTESNFPESRSLFLDSVARS